jgi:fructokinase
MDSPIIGLTLVIAAGGRNIKRIHEGRQLLRIGIDLGGTKIAGVALDEAGAEVARGRVATPREDYAATMEAIATLVADLEKRAGGAASVGIGMPGALSVRTGLVKNANSTWLNGKPFDRDISAVLGRPVRLANDANCLAVSEATDGAGSGQAVVFAVILGTGVGGGIAIGGRPIAGLNAIAGEWGHNPLPWPEPEELPGPACYCGKHGCVETWLSGPGMAADHLRVTGQVLDAAEIARSGDAASVATLERYRGRLARSLAVVINILDPDIIVIGGGVSQTAGLYDPLAALLARWCFSDGIFTPVVPALHGDDSGVRGAAWLWPKEG